MASLMGDKAYDVKCNSMEDCTSFSLIHLFLSKKLP